MAFIEPMHRNKPNITYLLPSCYWHLKYCMQYKYLDPAKRTDTYIANYAKQVSKSDLKC